MKKNIKQNWTLVTTGVEMLGLVIGEGLSYKKYI